MGRWSGYSKSCGTITNDIRDVDVTVTITEDDLDKMLKKYLSADVYLNLQNQLEETPPKEDFEYELTTDGDVDDAEMDINGSDIEDCLDQMDEEDAKEICFRFLNDSKAYFKPGSNERIILVPNLEAEREVEEFLESYNKKWSL